MCGLVDVFFNEQCSGPCVWWPDIASDFISGFRASRHRGYELRSFCCAILFISQISVQVVESR